MLDAFGIFVRDRDHLIARAALGCWQGREHQRIGLAQRFDGFRGSRVADDDGFHFPDEAMIDLEAQRDRDRRVIFPQRSEEADLAGLRIGDVELVCTEAAGSAPDAFAERNHLFVFGELDLGRERQTIGIARDHGVEILIDEAFQAGAITGSGGLGRFGVEREGHQEKYLGRETS